MQYLHDEFRNDVFEYAREVLDALEQKKELMDEMDLYHLRETVNHLRGLHNSVSNMDWLEDISYERDSNGTPVGVLAMEILDSGCDGVIPKIMHGVMYPGEAFPDGYIHIGDLMRRKQKDIVREKELRPWEVAQPSIEEISRRTEEGWLYTTGSKRTIRFTVPEESRNWVMRIDFNTPSQEFAGQILRLATGNTDLDWDSLLKGGM